MFWLLCCFQGHKFLVHYESQHTAVDVECADQYFLCTVCEERMPKEKMQEHARQKHFVSQFIYPPYVLPFRSYLASADFLPTTSVISSCLLISGWLQVNGFKKHAGAVEGQLVVKTGTQMRMLLGMDKIYYDDDLSDID